MSVISLYFAFIRAPLIIDANSTCIVLVLQLFQIHTKPSSSPLWAASCAGMSTHLTKISKWTQQHIILFLPSTLVGRYLQLLFLDHDTKCYLLMMILKFLLCLSTKTEEMALLICFFSFTCSWESIDSAVYSKTKISHCFLNLILFGCLLGLWILCIFKIFTLPGTVLQVSFFLRKDRFLLPYKEINASLQHSIILFRHIKCSASLLYTICYGRQIPRPRENWREGYWGDGMWNFFLYYFLFKF